MRRLLTATLTLAVLSVAQQPEHATIERQGDYSVLSVHTFRPVDVTATTLESKFSIAVGAEDPVFQFSGDLMDASKENPKLRAGLLVPARWGFQVRFPVHPDGSPRDVPGLLTAVLQAANAQSPFAFRLDEIDSAAHIFVPTRTRDEDGRSIAATPLLDRPVSIPWGIRKRMETAHLMAQDLSKQTGLTVSCCQSHVAGIPWGMEPMAFGAENEPARSVLKRLGLKLWHVRCDTAFCFIDGR